MNVHNHRASEWSLQERCLDYRDDEMVRGITLAQQFAAFGDAGETILS